MRGGTTRVFLILKTRWQIFGLKFLSSSDNSDLLSLSEDDYVEESFLEASVEQVESFGLYSNRTLFHKSSLPLHHRRLWPSVLWKRRYPRAYPSTEYLYSGSPKSRDLAGPPVTSIFLRSFTFAVRVLIFTFIPSTFISAQVSSIKILCMFLRD